MDWQQAASLGIVTLTAGVMLRRWILRRRRNASGTCSPYCSSCGEAQTEGVVSGPGRTYQHPQGRNAPRRSEREFLLQTGRETGHQSTADLLRATPFACAVLSMLIAAFGRAGIESPGEKEYLSRIQ